MSDDPQFLMQVITGASPDDPDPTIVPNKPFPVSLQDVVQYAWLAAIPAPYAKEVTDKAIADMEAAKETLTKNLSARSAARQARLTRKYGNHDSANKMESVDGDIGGTPFSMIQIHANLKKRGNADEFNNVLGCVGKLSQPYAGTMDSTRYCAAS